jgi:hypothetical protein
MKPRYFVAVFGNPGVDKDKIESGQYDPDPKYAPPVQSGDLMLLYCTSSYQGHEMEVPGVGVVLGKDSDFVHYRWLPFTSPIPKSALDSTFGPEDLKKFANIRFSSHWLFEITTASFRGAVGSRCLNWSAI